MRRHVRPAILCLSILLLSMTSAFAADAKTFAVLPFQVNGPDAYRYLEKAIPQMLTSRLYWRDHFHNLEASALTTTPQSESEARTMLQQSGADYLVYGSTTIIGNDSSIDVMVVGADGTSWPRSASSDLKQMIPTLKNLAEAINSEVFKRPGQNAAQAAQTTAVNQMNPGIIHNEVSPNQQVYLNPEFRYAGETDEGNRLRSNRLSFAAFGMITGDFDGDGKTDVVFGEGHYIRMYSFEDSRLTPTGEYKLPMSIEPVAIRAIDLNRDGRPEIIVSATDEDFGGRSLVLENAGKTFTPIMENIPYLLNVVRMSPDFMPTLVGQKIGTGSRLWKSSVYEMVKAGGDFTEGRRIDLPEGGNLYNCFWVPGEPEDGGNKLVMIEPNKERLRVFTSKLGRLAETDESYSGAAVGLLHDKSLPSMGKDKLLIESKYYIPIPLIPVDLNNDGKYEIMTNKPISVAAQFFDRYRYFPQGEIHSLFWDGVGLSLQWKTRRIKGSVVAFELSDVNNDGIRDLVVCITTHPGATGASKRKTMVLAYPLDLESTSNDTAIDKTFSEE